MATKPKQTWGAFGPVPRAGQSLYGYANSYTPTPKKATAVTQRRDGIYGLPAPGGFETPAGPDYVPDYAALISGDYEYQGALGAYGAADVQDEAQLNETIGSLNQSFESQKLDLGRQLQRGSAQGDVDLAARGTLGSGALAVLRGALNESHTRALNQAGEQRAQGERAARGSYASNVAARAAQLAALRASVTQRLMGDERYAPQAGAAGMKAKWNPHVQAYVDEAGGMYNAQQQKIAGSTYGGGTPGPVKVDAKGNVWSGGKVVYRVPVAPAMRRK